MVFLNRKLFYAAGANVAVAPPGSLVWRQGAMENYLEFYYSAGVAAGLNITITISPM